jgi:hypothetical protein
MKVRAERATIQLSTTPVTNIIMEFTLDLYPEGGANSLRVTNPADADFRTLMINSPNAEHSPLTMSVDIVEMHHGLMTWGDELVYGTLFIFQFRFQSRFRDRHYRSASVTIEFVDKSGNNGNGPEVVGTTPKRTKYLNRTVRGRENTKGADAKVGNDTAGAGAKWEVKDTYDKKYSARVNADVHFGFGKNIHRNEVTWAIEENTGTEDGVPDFLQTAVLLRRPTNTPFIGKMRVTSMVDWWSNVRRLLPVTTDKDIDPITIQPDEPQVKSKQVTGIKEEDLVQMQNLPVAEYFAINHPEDEEGEMAGEPSDSAATA